MTEERGKIFTIVERFEPFILVALAMRSRWERCSSCRWIDRLVRVARTQHKLEAIRAFHGSSCRKSRTLPGNRLLDVYGRRARRRANSLHSDLGISRFHGDTWSDLGSFLSGVSKSPSLSRFLAFSVSPLPSSCVQVCCSRSASAFAMMANGLGYLFVDPITGVGAMQWKTLNLQDADPFFNTNHIHNVFIHVGVEFGLIAMISLIVIAVRVFIKRYREAQHGEDAAFLFHLLTDTGFYYVGIVSTFILTAGGSTTPTWRYDRQSYLPWHVRQEHCCPGPYMKSRMDDLANAINAELERG